MMSSAARCSVTKARMISDALTLRAAKPRSLQKNPVLMPSRENAAATPSPRLVAARTGRLVMTSHIAVVGDYPAFAVQRTLIQRQCGFQRVDNLGAARMTDESIDICEG